MRGITGAPQIRSGAWRHTKLCNVSFTDHVVAGNGANRQRLKGDGFAANAAASVRIGYRNLVGADTCINASSRSAGIPYISSGTGRRYTNWNDLPFLANEIIACDKAIRWRLQGNCFTANTATAVLVGNRYEISAGSTDNNAIGSSAGAPQIRSRTRRYAELCQLPLFTHEIITCNGAGRLWCDRHRFAANAAATARISNRDRINPRSADRDTIRRCTGIP
jgi:hypothetical protein